MMKKDLADAAGYTLRRLQQINKLLPDNKKLFVASEADSKKFDLALFVQRWVAYNIEAAEVESEELSAIKAKHEKVKMEKTKLEVARMKGEYVSIDELAPVWSHIAALVAERFNNMPTKLAPSLVMIRDPETIADIIEREIQDAISPLAAMPLNDNISENSSDKEAEDDD